MLANFTKDNLLDATFREVTFWKEPIGWTSEAKNNFIDRNYELIRSKLLQLNSKKCNYNIFDEGLNPFIYESEEYKKFFNNCGKSKDWLYPIINVIISYNENKSSLQDHIEFLRTDNGYKLISLTIRKGEIK